jgi:hypothetical protein
VELKLRINLEDVANPAREPLRLAVLLTRRNTPSSKSTTWHEVTHQIPRSPQKQIAGFGPYSPATTSHERHLQCSSLLLYRVGNGNGQISGLDVTRLSSQE